MKNSSYLSRAENGEKTVKLSESRIVKVSRVAARLALATSFLASPGCTPSARVVDQPLDQGQVIPLSAKHNKNPHNKPERDSEVFSEECTECECDQRILESKINPETEDGGIKGHGLEGVDLDRWR